MNTQVSLFSSKALVNNFLAHRDGPEFRKERLFNHSAKRHAAVLETLLNVPLAGQGHPYDGAERYCFEGHNGRIAFFEISLALPHKRCAAIIEEDVIYLRKDATSRSLDSIDAMLHELSFGRPAVGEKDRSSIAAMFCNLWERMNAFGESREFDKAWANGTGYFNVSALPEDWKYDSFVFTDDKGRKGIVMWDDNTRSRVVMFQRYSNDGIVAYNHSFGAAKGVSGSGAVHTTPYMIGLLLTYIKQTSRMKTN